MRLKTQLDYPCFGPQRDKIKGALYINIGGYIFQVRERYCIPLILSREDLVYYPYYFT